jgi:hypothetical protein
MSDIAFAKSLRPPGEFTRAAAGERLSWIHTLQPRDKRTGQLERLEVNNNNGNYAVTHMITMI